MSYFRLSVIILLFCIGSSLAQEATPEATNEEAIEFTVFMFAETETSGIAPEGWEEVVVGSYLNPKTEDNANYLLHFASNDLSLEERLQPILGAFLQEDLPEEYESSEKGEITWKLYNFEYNPVQDSDALVVDIATAETDDLILVVVMQTTPDDYEALHDSLFLPAVSYFGQPLDVIESELKISTLIPETILEFGIDTVVPPNWENTNPGSYVRGDLQVDPTTLIIQTSADLSEDDFRDLFLMRLNITGAGDGETYNSDYLDWTLYTVDIDIEGILLTWQIATASDGDFAYLVVLFSFTDERGALYDTILSSVLDNTRQSE